MAVGSRAPAPPAILCTTRVLSSCATVASTATPTVHAALDELVHQFTDRFAFVRELVQNAIDAGSDEIHVDVRWQAGEHGTGVVSIHVDDFGDGMTREIIEKRLTRLFSSSKEGDHTKIGKFGIGFVSVFALDPEFVCIDTAREGESWRVLFRRDRTYELIALDQPVDGTKITLLLSGDARRHAEIARGCEAALRHWCRHVAADVRFAGASVREPFALPHAVVSIEIDDPFAKIVVGHHADLSSFHAFYNSGLTLFETTVARGATAALDGLAFKVSSPQLEHTLTRDAVIEDEGFHRALARVLAGARTELASAVFAALASEAEPSRRAALQRVALWHVAADTLAPAIAAGHAVVFTPAGVGLSISELRRRAKDRGIGYARQRSTLTDALEQAGFVVLHGSRETVLEQLAEALVPRADHHEIETRWCRPQLLREEDCPRAWPQLRDALAALLRAAGAKLAGIVPGDFDYPDSAIVERVAITQPEPGAIVGLDELHTLAAGVWSRRHALVVHLRHPAVREFLALASGEPDLAAYLLAKALRVGRSLDEAVDTRMLEHVMERRWPSSTP